MLHLKKHFTFRTSSLLAPHPMALSPVLDDDDELIQAIKADHEEAWELERTLDSNNLDSFWSGVQRDLAKDPNWTDFAHDDDDHAA